MAGMRPDAEAGNGSDRGSKPGMPRWVKVGILAIVVLVLVLVILTLTGVHDPQPAGHGP